MSYIFVSSYVFMKGSDVFHPALPCVHLKAGAAAISGGIRHPTTLSAGEANRNGIPALTLRRIACPGTDPLSFAAPNPDLGVQDGSACPASVASAPAARCAAILD